MESAITHAYECEDHRHLHRNGQNAQECADGAMAEIGNCELVEQVLIIDGPYFLTAYVEKCSLVS